jgi:hypothetical protein
MEDIAFLTVVIDHYKSKNHNLLILIDKSCEEEEDIKTEFSFFVRKCGDQSINNTFLKILILNITYCKKVVRKWRTSIIPRGNDFFCVVLYFEFTFSRFRFFIFFF